MIKNLPQGENISLNQIDSKINELVVGIKWIKKSSDYHIEVDYRAFLLNKQLKVRHNNDVIFDKQPQTANKSVILKENLFKIQLDLIDSDIQRIAFVLTIREAYQRQQNCNALEKIIVKLFDFINRKELANYVLQHFTNETSIILTILYRHQADWKFKAVGQGYVEGLNVLLNQFGVNVLSDSTIKADKNNTPQNNSTVNIKAETKIEKQSKPITNPQQNQSKSNQKLPPVKITPPVEQNKVIDKTNTPAKKAKSKTKNKVIETPSLTEKNQPNQQIIDIYNTKSLTLKEHYFPIVLWFNQKLIKVKVNEAAMDTSGFFDEIAVQLGDHYSILKDVYKPIKAQQRNINKQVYIKQVYIELKAYSKSDAELIKSFCQELYDYSFVAKYWLNLNQGKITLHLQTATRIVQFFNGEWLEWFGFMKVVEFCHQHKLNFASTRNMKFSILHDSYEIDIFFLINNQPLFIECKSGEFRPYIDRYSKLRKRLSIDKAHFIFLTTELDEKKAKGLTAMFDITFVIESQLVAYIENLFAKMTLKIGG